MPKFTQLAPCGTPGRTYGDFNNKATVEAPEPEVEKGRAARFYRQETLDSTTRWARRQPREMRSRR